MKLPTDRLTELEVVGWDTVVRFLKDAGDLPLEEGERVAEASKLIGTTAVDGMRRYVLQVNGVAYVAGAAIGGIATLLGSIATDPLVGSVIGTIAGAVGVADVRSRMRDHISSSLKKTWTGLLRSE
jgi:hypothetical protein